MRATGAEICWGGGSGSVRRGHLQVTLIKGGNLGHLCTDSSVHGLKVAAWGCGGFLPWSICLLFGEGSSARTCWCWPRELSWHAPKWTEQGDMGWPQWRRAQTLKLNRREERIALMESPTQVRVVRCFTHRLSQSDLHNNCREVSSAFPVSFLASQHP